MCFPKKFIFLFCSFFSLTLSLGNAWAWEKVKVATLEEIQALTVKAETGDAKAQAELGSIYGFCKLPLSQSLKRDSERPPYSEEVYKNCDEAKSFYWFQKAANSGYESAEYNLGSIYRHGEGVKKNYAQAAYWYKKAASHKPKDKGIYFFFIAKIYAEGGYGIQKDLIKARYWCWRACKEGSSWACGIY